VALSRPKHGFESRWGRHTSKWLVLQKFCRAHCSDVPVAVLSAVAVFVAA
jgi:hypothetical protein